MDRDGYDDILELVVAVSGASLAISFVLLQIAAPNLPSYERTQ